MIKVYLPELGEDIEKATVSYWYFEEGATVVEGNDLVELTTDKASFNVASPCSGTLVETIAHEGDIVRTGEVLALIQEDTVVEEEGVKEEEKAEIPQRQDEELKF